MILLWKSANNIGAQSKKLQLFLLTTFMIAQDPDLIPVLYVTLRGSPMKGKAFFTGLKGLGEMIF